MEAQDDAARQTAAAKQFSFRIRNQRIQIILLWIFMQNAGGVEIKETGFDHRAGNFPHHGFDEGFLLGLIHQAGFARRAVFRI